MKTKMHVVITDPIDFAKGDLSYSVSLMPDPTHVAAWINVHEVEIDFSSVDMPSIRKAAVEDIDEKVEEAKAAFSILMEKLETQRSSLLAITHEAKA